MSPKRAVTSVRCHRYRGGDGFLEAVVRHSRHCDLSLQFITQTGGEFSLTLEARTIADLCSNVLIHRVIEQAGKLAEWFGLGERDTNWVRTAKAGNEGDGYSEALLGVDEEGRFPICVRASPYEAAVNDGEAARYPDATKHRVRSSVESDVTATSSTRRTDAGTVEDVD